jgi:hypothetical protein
VEISHTAEPPPAVSTGSASANRATGATLHGTVYPEGLATSYEFSLLRHDDGVGKLDAERSHWLGHPQHVGCPRRSAG